MRLIASMIVRDEEGRYLREVIPHLLDFCDEIRVTDDGSTDGTYEVLREFQRVAIRRTPTPQFEHNEGIARHENFVWALAGNPTHILAIDADELVSDGLRLRAALEDEPDVPVWTLLVTEVWKVAEEGLWLRVDGGWSPHRAPVLYKAPEAADNRWRIPPRRLASGREPSEAVAKALAGEKIDLPVDLLHFGWARVSERRRRYERYALADQGEYHSNAHLESIMATHGVTLECVAWPEGLPRERLLALSRA